MISKLLVMFENMIQIEGRWIKMVYMRKSVRFEEMSEDGEESDTHVEARYRRYSCLKTHSRGYSFKWNLHWNDEKLKYQAKV